MRQGHHVRQQRKPFQPSHQSCLEAQCTDCTGCRRRRSETRECLHPLPAFRQSYPRIIRNDTISCSLRRTAFLFPFFVLCILLFTFCFEVFAFSQRQKKFNKCRKRLCNEILLRHNKQLQPVRRRKTVRVCYFMGLFACGFETRASPSDSLVTAGSFHLME